MDRSRLGEPVNTATGPPGCAAAGGRAAMRKRAAAEDVARIQRDDRFFAPDAPGREEDDL